MDKEIPQEKARTINAIVKNFYRHVLFSAGFYNIKFVQVKDDYAEFLGPGYCPPENFSTVVSNHSTPIDHVLLGYLCQ